MAFESIYELVVHLVWACLSDTPYFMKTALYARFFVSFAAMELVVSAANLSFAPGLLAVFNAAAPPMLDFFKNLPAADFKCWAVYCLVLQKSGHQDYIYIGSATSASTGLPSRMKQYDDGFLLPEYVEKALQQGYEIVHKGVLCWSPIPTAALVPITRLAFYALEGTFSLVFWSLRWEGCSFVQHLAFWPLNSYQYEGLCTHLCFYETPRGDFDLSPEQLEAQAVEKEAKRVALKTLNATNYHYKQMAENYDEYITGAIDRKMKSRALNPELDRIAERAREAKYVEEQRYYCDDCEIPFTRPQLLETHLQSAKHARKLNEASYQYRCKLCKIPLSAKDKYKRHLKSDRHKKNVELVKAAASADQ